MSTCTPAMTYSAIASIIFIIFVIIYIFQNINDINYTVLGSQSCCQLCSMSICTAILAFLCQQLGDGVSWVIVGIWLLCNCASLGSIIYSSIYYKPSSVKIYGK